MDRETRKHVQPLYEIWAGMKTRTSEHRRHQEAYQRYAGRGIRMYESWRQSYDEFESYILAELGERPSPKHSIDRIDNDGNYEPGNIRWATPTQQNTNTRLSKDKALRDGLWVAVAGCGKSARRELKELTGVSYR